MQTYFGGHGFYGFEDLGTFCLPSETAKLTIVHGGGGGQKIKLAHNFNASRGCCEMHANQIWWVWPLLFRRFW